MSLAHIGKMMGENNPAYKGDEVGYTGLHRWLRKNMPKPELCEVGGEKEKLEVANITGIYNRDFSNWVWACRRCHRKIDFPDGMMGKNFQNGIRGINK